jgi:single-strand DNA-binding protein
LTRDPELRYTPSGAAVCTFGVATNRQWNTDTGEKREDVEFHRVVAWNKLAELCAQLLAKGRKVFVEGRLQTRKWQTQEGVDRTTTEIVINEMIILDSRGAPADKSTDFDIPEEVIEKDISEEKKSRRKPKSTGKKSTAGKAKPSAKKKKDDNDQESEDIPF